MKPYLEQLLKKQQEIPVLSGLNQVNSNFSVFGGMLHLLAYCWSDLDKMLQNHQQIVEKKLDQQRLFSLAWYKEKVLGFQFGDELLMLNGQLNYQHINPEKQIIQGCSVQENLEKGGLIFKIVTKNQQKRQPLNEDEMHAFYVYLQQMKAAGTRIDVISEPAEKLNIQLKVQLNKMLFKNDGTAIASGKKEVEEAVENYIQNLDFDGCLYLSKLNKHLLEIPGVENAHVLKASVEDVDFNDQYQPKSGHLVVHQSDFIYV